MICAAVDSVVYQVTLLLSNNSLHHSEQYCVLGCCAPFLYWQFALLYVRLLCSLPTTVQIASEEREQSDLTYNSANCQ